MHYKIRLYIYILRGKVCSLSFGFVLLLNEECAINHIFIFLSVINLYFISFSCHAFLFYFFLKNALMCNLHRCFQTPVSAEATRVFYHPSSFFQTVKFSQCRVVMFLLFPHKFAAGNSPRVPSSCCQSPIHPLLTHPLV